jgi:hypothetical protein
MRKPVSDKAAVQRGGELSRFDFGKMERHVHTCQRTRAPAG